MPGADAVASGEASASAGAPSVGELLTVAADLAGLIGGRTEHVAVTQYGYGAGEVSLLVPEQKDAEHLSFLFGLGEVREYAADGEYTGSVIWQGSLLGGVDVRVRCPGIGVVRPVRAWRPAKSVIDEPVPYSLAAVA